MGEDDHLFDAVYDETGTPYPYNPNTTPALENSAQIARSWNDANDALLTTIVFILHISQS